MLTIEILEDGRTDVAGRISIGKPALTPEGSYACTLELEDMKGGPIFGATPLDALENALTVAKASASRVKGQATWRVV